MLGSNEKSFPELITLPNDFNPKCVFITSSYKNIFNIVGRVLSFENFERAEFPLLCQYIYPCSASESFGGVLLYK